MTLGRAVVVLVMGTAAVAACGSGPSTTFACPANDPRGNSACEACAASSCGSQASTALGNSWQSGDYAGACSAYIACVAPCSCSDTACDSNCSAMTTDACKSAENALLMCIGAATCVDSCATTTVTVTSNDGG